MALEITDANFAEVTKSGVVVVDFWAPWCGPCRMVAPIIDELAGEYEGKATIGKVNVDENPGVSASQSIRNIPTILFFKDGSLADRPESQNRRAALSSAVFLSKNAPRFARGVFVCLPPAMPRPYSFFAPTNIVFSFSDKHPFPPSPSYHYKQTGAPLAPLSVCN